MLFLWVREESKEDKINSRINKHNERAQQRKAEEVAHIPMGGKAAKVEEGKPRRATKEDTKVKTPAKAKKMTAAVKPDSEQLKLDVEQPKAEAKKPRAGAKGKTTKKVEPKVETPTTEIKTPKKRQTSTKKADTVATNVAKAVEPKKEKVKVKRGRKPKNTNEALADFVCLLSDTNISESAVKEIIGMISNKRAAKKAVERDQEDFKKALDALNHEERNATLTGVPVGTEKHDKLIKDAEEKGAKYERFKALASKKFGI